jgi:hypothetical protein
MAKRTKTLAEKQELSKSPVPSDAGMPYFYPDTSKPANGWMIEAV